MAGIIGALLLEQYSKKHQAYATYQQNAEADRRAASDEIAQACQNRTGDEFRSCVSERVEAYYRKKATDQDLQAQQDMAFWAAAMFFSSTILTSVGIALLWGTLVATRKTLREAENTTEAARLTLFNDRAWLCFHKIELRIVERLNFSGTNYVDALAAFVVFKNFGRTPATNVGVVREGALMVPGKTPSLAHMPEAPNEGGAIVAPSGKFHAEGLGIVGNEQTVFERGDGVFWVHAMLTYRDIFLPDVLRETEVVAEVVFTGYTDTPSEGRKAGADIKISHVRNRAI